MVHSTDSSSHAVHMWVPPASTAPPPPTPPPRQSAGHAFGSARLHPVHHGRAVQTPPQILGDMER